MNLWLRYVDAVHIVAPIIRNSTPTEIDMAYCHERLTLSSIPSFSLIDWRNRAKALGIIPVILFKVMRAMQQTDHIHLRCPGNVGLIGCLAQILFPQKKKTAKYAGNWDLESRQPWSYRLQQLILRSTFLSRNMTALIYGQWPDQTRNTLSFFTATYGEKDNESVAKEPLGNRVKLAYVGGLTPNKSPIIALEVLRRLIEDNIHAELTYCGDGPERECLSARVREWESGGRGRRTGKECRGEGVSGYGSQSPVRTDDGERRTEEPVAIGKEPSTMHQEPRTKVQFLGNVSAEKVKEVLKESHFLVFVSRSEGWPKAVAEAMWWGCVPITSSVSCVPQMVGERGERGYLSDGDPKKISEIIRRAMDDESSYLRQSKAAQEWARQYTLERFEAEIAKLL